MELSLSQVQNHLHARFTHLLPVNSCNWMNSCRKIFTLITFTPQSHPWPVQCSSLRRRMGHCDRSMTIMCATPWQWRMATSANHFTTHLPASGWKCFTKLNIWLGFNDVWIKDGYKWNPVFYMNYSLLNLLSCSSGSPTVQQHSKPWWIISSKTSLWREMYAYTWVTS